MKPRLGRGWAEVEGVNASVGVRIIPTKAEEQRTRVYPNIKEMRFNRQGASTETSKQKVRFLYDAQEVLQENGGCVNFTPMPHAFQSTMLGM